MSGRLELRKKLRNKTPKSKDQWSAAVGEARKEAYAPGNFILAKTFKMGHALDLARMDEGAAFWRGPARKKQFLLGILRSRVLHTPPENLGFTRSKEVKLVADILREGHATPNELVNFVDKFADVNQTIRTNTIELKKDFWRTVIAEARLYNESLAKQKKK